MSRLPDLLLLPPSLLYGAVVGMRNTLYDLGLLKSFSFDVPVICVGNLSAGGTGKTPHVIYLAELLGADGHPVILSRGYLRKSSGFRGVMPGDTVTESGDEPLLMAASLPATPVFVDRDRVNGVREILKLKPETTTVILDDGFQHRRVRAGLNIILTSYGRLMTRDSLLPRGRLRERLAGLGRAQAVIVTKVPNEASGSDLEAVRQEISSAADLPVFFSGLEYGMPYSLIDSRRKELKECRSVLLVTGIADPGPLKKYVSASCPTVRHISFPDHHSFTRGDAERISEGWDSLPEGERMIITTEKDGVRLKEFTNIADRIREAIYCLPVRVRFISDEDVFKKMILSYAGKNNRDR